MRRVVVALCLGSTVLLGLAQAAAGRQASKAPVWYHQYPVQPGNPVSIACADQSVCYAGGTDGAVLRTTDAGQTWQRQSVPVPTGFMIRAIACRSQTTCVASAHDRGGSFQTVLLATTNGGQTWQKEYTTVSGFTNGLACPVTGRCVVLLHGHFFATWSGGTRWSERDLPLPTTSMVADGLSCPAPGTCYVDAIENRNDGFGAMLATTNGGQSWRTHIIRPKSTHGYFMDISCPDTRTCYVVTNARSSGVLVTHDAWKTQAFHRIDVEVPSASGPGDTYFAQPNCPDDKTCYLRSTFGTVASTTNGGETWQEHPLDRPAPPFLYSYLLPQGVTSIACHSAQRCAAVQNNGNIALTADGGISWSTAFIGTARSLSSVACVNPKTCLAVGPDKTLLTTADGSTWSRWPYPLADAAGTLMAIACHNSSLCLGAGTGGAVARTRDSGATWKRSTIPVPGKDQIVFRAVACPTPATCYVGGYAYASAGSGLGQAVLFRTVDAGATWRPVALPPKTWTINAIACASDRICLAGGGDASDDDSYPAGSLLLTPDGGKTWRQLGTEAYFGITCPGGNACEVVGQSAGRAPLALRVTLAGKVAARWQGSAQRFFRESLNGVGCTGPRDCYAMGDAGLAARTRNGRRWTAAALGLAQLNAVACAGPARCYAVGSDSTILSTRASAESRSPVPTTTSSSGGPGEPPPTPALPPALPTPTQVPAGPGCPPTCAPGMVLYRAKWAHGFDGWRTRDGGTGGWQVKRGTLVSPSVTYQHPATAIMPPFQPGAHGIANYAVQFQARPLSRGIDFHVSIRRQGQRYDDFAVNSCCTNDTSVSIIYRDERAGGGYDTIVGDAQMPPLDAGWHTYRMEVRSAMLRFIVDGRILVRGLDRHVLAGGAVDLSGQAGPIMFRHFIILAL